MYLDNEGAITRIKKQQSYSNDFSFNMLTPDWDVIAQISNTLDTGNFLPTIQHIQGHQDKYKKYDDLSLRAKLNVYADLLTVEYWAPNKKTTRKAIRLPDNAVQLHINGVTVNSNKFSKLKNSATEGPLLRYIAKKRLWSDTKMALINWDAFQIARKHQSQHSKQIVKMVHGIVPMNKMLHGYKQTSTDRCPCCKNIEETHDHLILCKAIEPQKWRSGVLSEVRKLLP
eukprot:663511-Ditylum_brightwellii.AAC.1